MVLVESSKKMVHKHRFIALEVLQSPFDRQRSAIFVVFVGELNLFEAVTVGVVFCYGLYFL